MVLNLAANHKNEIHAGDKAVPMPAGPIVYREDGRVDWNNMWDSFCVLALDGGPSHRAEMLQAPINPDTSSETYRFSVAEISRGIWEVAELTAVPAEPGWLQIGCQSTGQARWLAEAIVEENVQARHRNYWLYVPVGDDFKLKKEIKNVITAVAKTSHYWQEHLAVEVKQALAFQGKITQIWDKLQHFLVESLPRKKSPPFK